MAEENVMVEVDEDEEVNSSEEELVVTESPPEKEEPEGKEDEPIKAEEDGVDAERESIRERRRKEKVDRKERRETAIKRDKTELDFLRSRNDNLERRLTAQERKAQESEVLNIDQQIIQANKEAQMADRVIAKAVEENNGGDVTKAMKYRDQAMAKVQQLAQAKQHVSQVAPAPAVDERTMHYAQEFMKENPWYDVQDGYNPQTEEYWDELRMRAARRIPERFDDDYDEPKSTARKPRGGPKVGSGREHAPTSTRKEIYISPERKAALVDAGVWDDPVLRMKYVKRYAAYDKENS